MRKAISLKVSLWIEGEDEPAHNFAESTKQAVRDIIAAGIYIVFLVIQIVMWLQWQKRDQKKPGRDELTSAYGRPLVRGS